MRTGNKRHDFQDGIILPGSKRGKRLAFEPKVFYGYLWKQGDEIWISEIHSLVPGRGNFKALINYLNDLGYKILVPTPINNMESILLHLGFEHETRPWESSPDFQPIRAPHSGNIWHRHKMGVVRDDQFLPDLLIVDVWVRKSKPVKEENEKR